MVLLQLLKQKPVAAVAGLAIFLVLAHRNSIINIKQGIFVSSTNANNVNAAHNAHNNASVIIPIRGHATSSATGPSKPVAPIERKELQIVQVQKNKEPEERNEEERSPQPYAIPVPLVPVSVPVVEPSPKKPKLRLPQAVVEPIPVVPNARFQKEDYNFCRITPEPQMGQRFVPVPELGIRIPPFYQCAGTPYYEHMEIIHSFLEKRYHQDPTELWGRRPFPVPVITPQAQAQAVDKNSTATKTKKRTTRVLVLGNSHTRQVMSSLLCQYKHLIINATQFAPIPGSEKNNEATRFEVKGGLTIFVIVNHPFVYSKPWARTLSLDILGFPLHLLDAIVLGSFNELKESYKTNFLLATLDYQKRVPQHEVDFNSTNPPFLEDVAAVFPGPIIWMSMFAIYNQEYHDRAVQTMQDLREKPNNIVQSGGSGDAGVQQGTVNGSTAVRQQQQQQQQQHKTYRRTNIRAVYGRNYIADELNGTECSSDKFAIVSTCVDKAVDSKRYSDGHRCVGGIGSFPDLIAWDLIEAFWDVMGGGANTVE